MKIITRSHAIPKSVNTGYYRVSKLFNTKTELSLNFSTKYPYSFITTNRCNAMSNC